MQFYKTINLIRIAFDTHHKNTQRDLFSACFICKHLKINHAVIFDFFIYDLNLNEALVCFGWFIGILAQLIA